MLQQLRVAIWRRRRLLLPAPRLQVAPLQGSPGLHSVGAPCSPSVAAADRHCPARTPLGCPQIPAGGAGWLRRGRHQRSGGAHRRRRRAARRSSGRQGRPRRHPQAQAPQRQRGWRQRRGLRQRRRPRRQAQPSGGGGGHAGGSSGCGCGAGHHAARRRHAVAGGRGAERLERDRCDAEDAQGAAGAACHHAALSLSCYDAAASPKRTYKTLAPAHERPTPPRRFRPISWRRSGRRARAWSASCSRRSARCWRRSARGSAGSARPRRAPRRRPRTRWVPGWVGGWLAGWLGLGAGWCRASALPCAAAACREEAQAHSFLPASHSPLLREQVKAAETARRAAEKEMDGMRSRCGVLAAALLLCVRIRRLPECLPTCLPARPAFRRLACRATQSFFAPFP